MRLPSRLPYSPLPRGCGGADTVSDDDGRVPVPDGRLAGRLGDRRTDERDRDEPDRGRDRAEPRLAGDPEPEPSLPDPDMDIVAGLAAADRDAVLDLDVLARDVDRGRDVVRDRDVDRRVPVVVATFADCMVLAAVVRAFAAVVMALVAVFIDCI
ncbi:MAG: hypothetical protein J2P27_19595, partial [Actinobacteria bacterium]|nr:hypothetical protein [Actinomycetota bacterium]